MNDWKRVGRLVVLAVGVWLLAQPVCAQTGSPARPYRTLFGGSDSAKLSAHALDLSLFVDGGGDNGLAAAGAIRPTLSAAAPATLQSFYSAGAELGYTRRSRRVEMHASGASSLPHYSIFPEEARKLVYNAGADVGFVSGPTAVNASGSYVYSPYYSPALDASAGIGPGLPGGSFDYASALNPNRQTAAGASLTRRFGRHTSMSLAYAFNGTAFVDEERSNRSQSARLSANRRLSRRVNLSGGYAYRQAEYTTTGTPTTTSGAQDVDVEIGLLRRPLRGRTGGATFSLGASVIDENQRRYEGWRGGVQLTHSLGAGWTAGAGYHRSLQFYPAISQPVWADVANVMTGGRLGRRVDLSFDANYSGGNKVALGSPRFNIYSGTARARVALAASVAITADYIYYRYEFPAGYVLPAGMSRRLDRQRVQLGVRFWLPLVRAGRAPEPRNPVDQ